MESWTFWTYLFLGLFLGSGLLFFLLHQVQRNELTGLRRALSCIRDEERRVFAFLHGLGEAFSGDFHVRDLHRIVVEGARDALEADGAALYLADIRRGSLLPAFITAQCPALVEVPEEVRRQAEGNPAAQESYLRLHPVAMDKGLPGEAYQLQGPMLVDGAMLEKHGVAGRFGSAVLAPMVYHGAKMGVLCVVREEGVEAFTGDDFPLMAALAEQSAFALFNARVHGEAGEKRRLEDDLQMAREIQGILLPERSPRIEGYEIEGRTLPARLVSGDYFDYIRVDEDRLGIVIADVSGKGVPASLIMAMCRSVLRGHAVGNPSPADVLKKVNRQLYPDMKEDMFISMAYLVFDTREGTLTMARAGHDPPLHFRHATSEIRFLEPRGMAIGIDSGNVFDRVTADFAVGIEPLDGLLLYTDGVTEAKDANGSEFGMDRVKETLLSRADQGASAVVSHLVERLEAFTADQPQYDDITIIAIRKR